MKEDKIVMSQKELQRAQVLDQVEKGFLCLVKGADLMGVCYRQAKRLLAAYRQKGAVGLCHGNRGRHPPNQVSPERREEILRLSEEKYKSFNDSHFTEYLARDEGIVLGRETVRQIRRKAGIAPKRKRRGKKHHKRRPRKPLPGAMMQWDGSPHPWFGPDRPPCCLMASIDDATSRILWARFEVSETSLAYLRLLDGVIDRHGIPASVYQDRHGALFRNDDRWTLEEQLAGEQTPTQVGRVLSDLGIQPIRALSPQAKGRVERLFGTLQDRMVAEMALAGIDSIDKANVWLPGYIDRHNRQYAVPAGKTGTLFRKPGRLDLEKILSFRYAATVGNDNAVRIGGLVIDIPPGPAGRGYAKAKVDVRQLLDGSWRVYYQGKTIAQRESTALHAPLKAYGKSNAKGAKNWTWVYLESAPDAR